LTQRAHRASKSRAFYKVSVANFGVGGYGPDQAVLKVESLIDLFPRARVVVLAIMYDQVGRMVNSYRPVYYPDTGIT
jgi:hypothetical protein